MKYKKPVNRLVSMAITSVKKKARRRHQLASGHKPAPRYTKEMKEQATGFLCVHRLVRKAISKAKTMARARVRIAEYPAEKKALVLANNYQKNKEKRRKQHKEYRKTPQFKKRLQERMLTDPQFLLNTRLRRRLHSAMSGKADKKAARTMTLVGCTREQLVEHLSSQIPDGDKLNDYVIDHIFPLARYDLEDEKQQCMAMHWSNLRMTTREENAEKHDRIPTTKEAAGVERHCWPYNLSESDLN